MYKNIFFLITLFFISTLQIFAGVSTDKYCHSDAWWLESSTDMAKPLFSVAYDKYTIPIYESLKMDLQYSSPPQEPYPKLYYTFLAQTGSSIDQYDAYEYDCASHKPKKLASLRHIKNPDLWPTLWLEIQTYAQWYIVYAYNTGDGWIWSSLSEGLYIYDIRSHRMVVQIPSNTLNKDGNYTSVFRKKDGTFLLTWNHDEYRRDTRMIQVNPKTQRVIDL